ncbi:MAG: hypothetical protein ACYCP0_10940, partial [Acidiferrobacteraceae bacterium]
ARARGLGCQPRPRGGQALGYTKKAVNRLVCLDGQRHDELRFATDFNVGFTNYPELAVMPRVA